MGGNPDGPPLSPSALDLTDLDTVKGWLASTKSPAGDGDDGSIQLCITAASMWWLDQTGLGNANGINTASPLNSICTFTENYNGNGSNHLYLRNRPIQSVTSLTVGYVTIAQSTAYGVPGWVIDQDAKSIWIRAGGGGNVTFSSIGWPVSGSGYWFAQGIQNVAITYTAGYSTVPYRVQMAVTQQVALNVKRKEWIGLASKAMANGAGTVTFNKWLLDPEVRQALTDYTRTAMY
jgi:hypothetical protein